MWPYTDDESLWLDQPSSRDAARRPAPQGDIRPELVAYHASRARQSRAATAGDATDATGVPGGAFRQRWIGHWPTPARR